MRGLVLGVTFGALTMAASGEGRSETIRLCVDKGSELTKLLSPAPTDDVAAYAQGLRSGKFFFDRSMGGFQAAAQLGFRKRFGGVYNELSYLAQRTLRSIGRLHIDQVIEHLDSILAAERAADDAASSPDGQLPAVYLRALQSGECSSPGMVRNAPDGARVAEQLARAYPESRLMKRDRFVSTYDRSLAFARDQMDQHGNFSIHQIIGFWRTELRSGR